MKKIVLLFLIFPLTCHAETFDQWLADYKRRAVIAGVSAEAVNYALSDVQFNSSLIEQDRKQPEKQLTLQEYVDRTVTEKRIATGQDKAAEYRTLLKKTEQYYGVPGNILVALWGKETDYGGFIGRTRTIDSLATLAYEGRRRHFFEQELLAAIVLLNRLKWSPDQMVGSWAGAVGQCQFMPSNYAKYGVDGKGDGKVNLWDTASDVFYSMANMLRSEGWQSGMGWGQRVQLPAGFDKSLIGRDKSPRPVQFWEQRGVRFTKSVPSKAASAVRLYQPDEGSSQAYAIYSNFDVLMRWNRSGYFAVAVGLLSDSISSQ